MTRSDFLPNPFITNCVHCSRYITDPKTKCPNCRAYVHEKTCEKCPHEVNEPNLPDDSSVP